MNNPKFAALCCLFLAFASLYFAIEAVFGNQFPAAISIAGLSLIFIWHAVNAEMMVTKITLDEYFSKYSIEKSKAKYLAIIGILCIPVSFAFKAIEWL